MVFQALAPNACPPSPLPPPPPPASRGGARPSSRSSLSRNKKGGGCSSSPPHPGAAAAGGAVGLSRRQPGASAEGGAWGSAETATGWRGALDDHGAALGGHRAAAAEEEEEEAENSTRGGGGEDPGNSGGTGQRPSRGHGRGNVYGGSVGGVGGGGGADHEQLSSGEDDSDGGDDGDDNDDRDHRQPQQEEAEPDPDPEAGGVSFGLRPPGRRWRSETANRERGGEGDGEERKSGAPTSCRRNRGTAGSGGREATGRALPRRRRRRRSREAGGGGGGGRVGARRDREATRLRCTRGYQEHLERRLELTQVCCSFLGGVFSCVSCTKCSGSRSRRRYFVFFFCLVFWLVFSTSVHLQSFSVRLQVR